MLTLTGSPSVSGHFHTLLGFALVLHVINSFVAVLIYSIFTCTRIPCRYSHCENGSFEVLSLQRTNIHFADTLSVRRQVARIHENMGHPSNCTLVRVLRLGGAKGRFVLAAAAHRLGA